MSSKKILKILTKYLENNPTIRFGQALTNLNINEFADKKNPHHKNYLLRDIYNDSDEDILARIEQSRTIELLNKF